VTAATPAPAQALVAQGRAELMTEALPVDAAGGLTPDAAQRALELARHRNAVVLGPGLGQGDDVRAFVRAFVADCRRPLVLDADGLNALVDASPDAGPQELAKRSAATVLTPHPGEMARLQGTSVADVQARRLEAARGLADAAGPAPWWC
jgi:NAD(P)H-hydrate epimerase